MDAWLGKQFTTHKTRHRNLQFSNQTMRVSEREEEKEGKSESEWASEWVEWIRTHSRIEIYLKFTHSHHTIYWCRVFLLPHNLTNKQHMFCPFDLRHVSMFTQFKRILFDRSAIQRLGAVQTTKSNQIKSNERHSWNFSGNFLRYQFFDWAEPVGSIIFKNSQSKLKPWW